ncbi:MAG: hypothetical protein II425_01030 [Oscillospiraceae bacterium]|nr:hypothetical protein [Oscillospiraceae bacterium]
MSLIFLILFAAFSAAHLVFSLMDNKKGRTYTKPFLAPLMLLAYLFSGTKVCLPLAAALAACWLVDILLIPKGKLTFALGGVAFTAAHVLFIIAFSGGTSGAPFLIPALEASVLGGIAVTLTFSVRDGIPKGLALPLGAYLALNGVMNAFALRRFLALGGAGSLLILIGAAFFYVSDCLLLFVRFHRNRSLIPGKHFCVMMGYLAALLLITTGLAL